MKKFESKQKKQNKRILLPVLVIIAFLFTGAGCFNQAPKSTPIILKVWNLYDDETVFQDAIRKFQEVYPHITIQYTKKDLEANNASGESGYESALVNALAEGSGPDIFTFNNTWQPKYKKKLIQAPDPLFSGKTDFAFTLNNNAKAQEKLYAYTDNEGKALANGKSFVKYPDNNKSEKKRLFPTINSLFVDAVSKDLVDEDGIWGVALSVDSLAMYYNKDLLNSAGVPYPPKDWTDFQAAVKKITKTSQGVITQSGAAIGTSNNVAHSADLLSLLIMQQCGARECMVNIDKTAATFNDPIDINGTKFIPGQTALEFYTGFANQSKSNYSWSVDIFKNDNLGNALDAFAAGKVGMLFDYYSADADIQSKNANLNYGIAAMPQQNTNVKVNYSNYWALGVSKNSQYPLESWAFLDFLSQEEYAKAYLKATGKPTSERKLLTEYTSEQPAKIFADQALTARNWYKIDALKTDSIFNKMINDVVANNIPVADAAKTGAMEVNALMEK
jgi:ABC-type glycerol-3-phosphate transport system substrate-binding protein